MCFTAIVWNETIIDPISKWSQGTKPRQINTNTIYIKFQSGGNFARCTDPTQFKQRDAIYCERRARGKLKCRASSFDFPRR